MLDNILAASASLPELVIPPGTTVLYEGESRGKLYVLVAGTVEVSRNNVTFAVLDEPGAIFGEMATLLDTTATASVRTVSECRFRVCDEPEQFLRMWPEVAYSVAQMLARRLDSLTHYLVDVRAQYSDRSDHLAVVDVVLESLTHTQGNPADLGSDREDEAPY